MNRAKLIPLTCLMFVLIIQVFATANVRASPDKYFFKVHIATTQVRIDEVNYILSELRKIGIDAEVHTMDYNSLLALRDGKSQSFDQGGWDIIAEFLASSPDPDISYYYLSDNMVPKGNGNFANFNNAVSDKLLTAASAELNQTKRKQLYGDWLQLIDDQIPYVVLFQTKGMVLFSNKVVEGWDQINNWYMSFGTDNIRLAPYVRLQPGLDTYIVATSYRSPNFIGPLAFSFCRGIASSLVKVQGITGQVYPELAQSWEYSKDGLTATFHLRRDAVWSDGVPFTSKDVKFTYDSIMNPDLGATFGSKFRGIIKSVEAPDDYTIVLNLSKPYAPLLTMLGFRFGNEIVPFHTLSNIPLKDWRTSDANLKPGVLPSLGPYKPIEKVEGQYTLYAKNDLWFGWGQDDTQQVNNAPKYVRHVVIPEAATALAALEKGDVHFLEHFYKLDAEYPRLSKETAVHVLTTPTYYLEDLHINLNNPVLSNKWVRKAISYAIPRETYVKQVINGLGIPISLPIPLSSWAYNPSVKSPHPYDIAQARQFMTTAGYNYDWLAPPEIPYSAYVIGLVLGVAAGAIVSALIIKTRHKKA